jgi:hypothetical protein
MLTYHACEKCDAPVRRSRRKNLWEFLLGPIMLPYRCTVCDRREMKLRWLDMEPGSKPEEVDDLIITQPTERELEEERKAEARAAERAAKKAAKDQEKNEAKKETKKVKAAAAAVGATRQSNTSDEEEEQISPS